MIRFSNRPFVTATAVCLLSTASVAGWAQTAGTPLAPYHDKNRVLLVFAPSANDARYKTQMDAFSDKNVGEKDRDIVKFSLLEKGQSRGPRGFISTKDATGLRDTYKVAKGAFRVLLIGKDGNTAYSQASPVTAANLFKRIDRMPMRREEMQRHP